MSQESLAQCSVRRQGPEGLFLLGNTNNTAWAKVTEFHRSQSFLRDIKKIDDFPFERKGFAMILENEIIRKNGQLHHTRKDLL